MYAILIQINVTNLNAIPNFSQKLNYFIQETIHRLKKSACTSNKDKQLKQVGYTNSHTADIDCIITKL